MHSLIRIRLVAPKQGSRLPATVPFLVQKKQSTVSRCSTQAEYTAMAVAAAQLKWITYVLKDLHIYKSIYVLFCDNLSALHLTVNPVFHSRSKHSEIYCYFVR